MNTPSVITSATLVALITLTGCDQKNNQGTTQESAAPAPAATDTNSAKPTPPAPAPDNTASNSSDAANAKTPMDQSETVAHIKVTADIRRAILDDEAMSMNAQNCKIITDSTGTVTLRGVVDSQAEKDSIEAKAQAIAGTATVDNQLEVKTS